MGESNWFDDRRELLEFFIDSQNKVFHRDEIGIISQNRERRVF